MFNVEYEMECSHKQIGPINDLNRSVLCTLCNRHRRIVAIETREWKWKCNKCKTARYCGQDYSSAYAKLLDHQNRTGHQIGVVEYVRYPPKRERVIKLFGARMRTVIVRRRVIQQHEVIPQKPIPQAEPDNGKVPF